MAEAFLGTKPLRALNEWGAGMKPRQSPAGGVDEVISIAGISALDNSSSLANTGVAYLILWSARGPGEDLRSLVVGLNRKLGQIPEARMLVIPPSPIQAIGNAAGFAMQVELRDGNADILRRDSAVREWARRTKGKNPRHANDRGA